MFSVALLLLLAAGSRVKCAQLTQSPSVTVHPGQRLTITCQVSYSLGWYTGWIRQPAGKGLEWIGVKHTSASYYKDSLKNKFSIDLDTSSNTITLNGQNMQPEDTALYYCARRDYDAFDYWGKGTMVTVTSATSTAPTVFPLVPCGFESGDMVTLGCLATGFNPPAVTFSWRKGSTPLTDFIQYPAVQKGNVYTGVSQVRVRRQDWNARQNFQCAVTHAAGNGQASITKPQVFEQNPTLKVISSPDEDGTYTTCCFAKEFAPKKHEIKWLQNGADITRKIDLISTVSESKKPNGKKVYNAASFLIVNSSDINERTAFMCIFTGGQSASLNKTDRDNTVDISTTADPKNNGTTVTVHTLPQLHTDPLTAKDEITLVCLVTSTVNKMYKIEWTESYGQNSGRYLKGTDVPLQQSKNDKKWRSMSLYTTTKENWYKSNPTKMFTCHVQPGNLNKSVSVAHGNSKETDCIY